VHIHPALAFYSATLGAARALRLEGRIGSFQRNSEADVVVLNPFGSYDTARHTDVIYKTSSSGAGDGAGHGAGAAGGDASLDYLWKRLFILMTAGHAGGAGGVGAGVGAGVGRTGRGRGAGAGGNIAATYIAGRAFYVNANMPLTKNMEEKAMKATTTKATTMKAKATMEIKADAEPKGNAGKTNSANDNNSNNASSILNCVLPTNPQFPKDHMKVAECAAALAMSIPIMDLLQQEEDEDEDEHEDEQEEDDNDQNEHKHEDQAQARPKLMIIHITYTSHHESAHNSFCFGSMRNNN
jgi:hypothetical protein